MLDLQRLSEYVHVVLTWVLTGSSTCVHGNWRCEQDENCPREEPQFCHVKDDDCPRGKYCQVGKFEPDITALDIGLGICVPTDEGTERYLILGCDAFTV